MKTLAIFFFLCPIIIWSQYTVQSKVADGVTGKPVSFAQVQEKGTTNGVTTANDGSFTIQVKSDTSTLIISMFGYKAIEVKANSIPVDGIKISEDVDTFEAVEITAKADNESVTNTDVGVVKMSAAELEKIPVLFGEPDLMKTLQLMPGISSAGEGNSGFYVRGGSVDQNLVLLDGATLYNPSHLLGFFSVFNSAVIKDLSMYKSVVPAKFGGRMSSVLDVTQRPGDMEEFHVNGGIGVIASKIAIEGPLAKDKASFIVSGRRTYADLFLKVAPDTNLRKSRLYFYDANARVDINVGKKDRIFMSGYYGSDLLGFGESFSFDYGNGAGVIGWNHYINSNNSMELTASVTNYDYNVNITSPGADFKITNGILDGKIGLDFIWLPNKKHKINYGGSTIFHQFKDQKFISNNQDVLNTVEIAGPSSFESALYFMDEWEIHPLFKVNYGMRVSMFNQMGPGTYYDFDEDGNMQDTLNVTGFESVHTYVGWEPRIAMTILMNENNSIKLGYSRNYQYLHLLLSAGTSQPTDLWIPSSMNVKPEISDQVSVGFFTVFGKTKAYEASVELYYKTLGNQIDYRNGAQTLFNELVESELVFGDGFSTGAEFLIKKRKGKFTGWISYTLAFTRVRFDEIDNGMWFSPRQDRTHDISVVGVYDITKQISVSANFVYYTGDAVTWPNGKYFVSGTPAPQYGQRNSQRFPGYHRMDLGVTFYDKPYKTKTDKITGETVQIKRKLRSNFNVSIYNLYAKENPYTIGFEDDPNSSDPLDLVAKQTALFKIIPSFTWNFEF